MGEGIIKACRYLKIMELPFVGSKNGNTGKIDAVFGWIFGRMFETDDEETV